MVTHDKLPRRAFTDFWVQVLDDNAFLAGVQAVGWPEFSKLVHEIQNLGHYNFLTKNTRKHGVDYYDTKFGEFGVYLVDYNSLGKVRLHYSLFGFKSPECDSLKDSRLYPALNDYIICIVQSRLSSTIFGQVLENYPFHFLLPCQTRAIHVMSNVSFTYDKSLKYYHVVH